MSNTDLQQSLFEAMKIVSRNAVDKSKAALTIKAKIIDIKDEGKHIYTVSYRNNTFDATSNNDLQFQVGDNVYILVPDGDLSKEKLIIGAVDSRTALYVSSHGNDNKYITISDNLIAGSRSVDLRSWVDEEKLVPADFYDFNILFPKYMEEYKNFVFSAKIKTEIDKDHQKEGQYGIILHLPILRDPGNGSSNWIEDTYDCRMDTLTIQGNVYDFSVSQLSNIYFTFPDNVIYDTNRLPTISAFVNGFGYSEPFPELESDIHFSDIEIKIVDKLSDSEISGYHLALVSSNGNYFLVEDQKDKKLKPILKINGKQVDISDWDCYWFKEDASIKTDDRDYYNLGGLGWKCLNEKINQQINDEGKEVFEYKTSDRNWSVSADEVPALARYKCVLIQDDVVVNAIIKLENLKNEIKIDLFSSTGSNNFIKDIGEVALTAQIIYPNKEDAVEIETEWLRYDKNGNYIDSNFYELIRLNDKVDTYKWETEIRYPCSLVDEMNTVICNFYSRNSLNERINLGACTLLVSTISNSSYILSTYGGDVLYKYDSDGDSPLIANYDGPLSSRINTINPIEFKIFKPNGTELTEKEYLACYYSWAFPKNSMLELVGYDTQEEKDTLRQDDDYYYLEGYGKNDLNYTIGSLFNKRKNNNSIILNVNFDHNNLFTVISPKIMKEGESGTNGNKFSVIIEHEGYGYGEIDKEKRIRKLQFVYFTGNNSWYRYSVIDNELVAVGNPTLSTSIYKDGSKITDLTNYNFTWEMFDSYAGSASNNKVNFACCTLYDGENDYSKIIKPSTLWADPSITYTNVVRVKVDIPDTDIDKKETVYGYYPIEITWINGSFRKDSIVPTITGGFDQVVYGSDGTGAEYDSSTPFKCNDYLYEDNSSYYWYEWEGCPNIRVSSGNEAENKATPITKFDSGISKNYIKVRLTLNSEQRSLIENQIDELEDENTSYLEYKNYYSNSKDYMSNFSVAFNESVLKTKIENANGLLTQRAKMLSEILNLYSINEDIYEAFQSSTVSTTDYNYEEYYNNSLNKLNIAKRVTYNLINTGTLSNLSNLNNLVLNESIVEQYNSKVMLLNKYFEEQKMHFKKYSECYTKITAQSGGSYNYQNELNYIQSAFEDIRSLVNNSNLTALTQEHGGDEQQYVNLKNSLIVIYNNMKNLNNNGNLNTLNSLLSVVKQLATLLKNYQNEDYQENYFDNKISNYENKISDNEKLINSKNSALLPASTDLLVHIKPIIMLFNRYELTHLNGWDGNKLYTDEVNNQYILAPQFGAGKKENGTFTGITMGIRKFNNAASVETGIFGYSDGQQSLFLNAEDGSAIFGRSGSGQILIDPSTEEGKIYSGNYYDASSYGKDGKVSPSALPSGKGMMINLTEGQMHLGTSIGKIHSGNHSALNSTVEGFYLSHDGLSIGNTVKINASQNGSFKFGVGENSISFENNELKLGSGVKITWDRVLDKGSVISTDGSGGTTNIDDVNLDGNDDFAGLKDEYSDFREAVEGSLGVTTITSTSVISPKIGGGYLYITGTKGSVEINPKGMTGISGSSAKLFSVKNSSDEEVIWMDNSGNANFSGNITGSEITGSKLSTTSASGNYNTVIQNGLVTFESSNIYTEGSIGQITGDYLKFTHNGAAATSYDSSYGGDYITLQRYGRGSFKVSLDENGTRVLIDGESVLTSGSISDMATKSWVGQNYASIDWVGQNYATINWVGQNYASQEWVRQNFAAKNHSHSEYAASNHNHDGAYVKNGHYVSLPVDGSATVDGKTGSISGRAYGNL